MRNFEAEIFRVVKQKLGKKLFEKKNVPNILTKVILLAPFNTKNNETSQYILHFLLINDCVNYVYMLIRGGFTHGQIGQMPKAQKFPNIK